MKLKLLLTAAAVFAAVPAQAQDAASDAGAGNGTFTGPRIQAQVGWDRTGINIADTRNFGGRGDFGQGSEQDNEVAYGGEVGFDFDLGGFVVGVYAGADFSNAAEGFDFNTATPPQPRILIESDRNAYVGARLGFVAGEPRSKRAIRPAPPARSTSRPATTRWTATTSAAASSSR
jgi:outer membrane immunogenic protein